MRYAIADGILSVWQRRDWNARGGLGEMEALIETAFSLADADGLAVL